MAKPIVWIITYYWPPGSGPGVQRWLKFVKYFDELGADVRVVTVRNGTYPMIDESLSVEIPTSISILKTKTFEVYRLFNVIRGRKGKATEVGLGDLTKKQSLFTKLANQIRSNYFIPDGRVGWRRYARKALLKEINLEESNVMITTGPPQSTHLIGLDIKKHLGDRVKWIMDMRDPWVNIYYNKHLQRSKSAQQKDQRLEDESLGTADSLVVVNNGLREEFSSRAKQVEVITNGWDAEDFPASVASAKEDKFVVRFTGNLGNSYDIPDVWKGIAEGLKGHLDRVEFRFTGHVGELVKQHIEQFGLSQYCVFEDFVPHQEAVKRMIDADLLLLPIPPSENMGRIVPGKVFEYLASSTPILGIGPSDSAASEILVACNRDTMVSHRKANLIAERCKEIFSQWEKTASRVKHEGDEHLVYIRKALSERYLKHIEAIA